MDACDIARDCVRRGINPVPVAHRGKNPVLNGWQNRQITNENLESFFAGRPLNVGAQLGVNSGGLTDVDLDCPEAVTVAHYLLPKTQCVFGRESRRMSHRFYRTTLFRTEDRASIIFKDPTPNPQAGDGQNDHGANLLELRIGGGGAGAQTVFPGSTHQTGEAYKFEPDCDGEPASVDNDILLRAVKLTAAATLFARHWPGPGKRHEARLAVTGLLAVTEMTEVQARLFIEAVIQAAGDRDLRDAQAAVTSTYKALASGGHTTGLRHARQVFGDVVANKAAEWLECRPVALAPIAEDAARFGDLAKLPRVDYDRLRVAEAKKLGMRVGTLDREVEERRSGQDQNQTGGLPLSLSVPEPWPEEVDGADLLDRLERAIGSHVKCSPAAAAAVALWCVHAHGLDAFVISPRLAITSPEKRCGKTTLLRVIGKLTPKALPAANITAAALFRTVEKARPTLLIDEADTFLSQNEELRGVINSGHESGGKVIRLVGEDHEPRAFSTYCPTAIAAIGAIPGTIEDRSVSVALRRRKQDEPVSRFRADRTAHLDELNRMAARWARDNLSRLAEIDPEIPQQLHDRAADNWRPLIAIADRADGEWPARARSAALELNTDAAADDGDATRTMLLADTRDIFGAKSADRITSQELTSALSDMLERPWPRWHSGRPISAAAVARLLKPYGIGPQTIRIDAATLKGYYRADFDDAFARYLPNSAVTTSQARNSEGFRDSLEVTAESS